MIRSIHSDYKCCTVGKIETLKLPAQRQPRRDESQNLDRRLIGAERSTVQLFATTAARDFREIFVYVFRHFISRAGSSASAETESGWRAPSNAEGGASATNSPPRPRAPRTSARRRRRRLTPREEPVIIRRGRHQEQPPPAPPPRRPPHPQAHEAAAFVRPRRRPRAPHP